MLTLFQFIGGEMAIASSAVRAKAAIAIYFHRELHTGSGGHSDLSPPLCLAAVLILQSISAFFERRSGNHDLFTVVSATGMRQHLHCY